MHDEEVAAMVSKTVASLDQWVSQVDQILEEEHETALSPSLAATSEGVEREVDRLPAFVWTRASWPAREAL